MSKKPKLLSLVNELEVGTVFRLPADFKVDHAEVVTVMDAANDNSTAASVKGKLSILTLKATSGPFKGNTATILLPSSDEVEVIKKPKSNYFWQNWGAGATIIFVLSFFIYYNENFLKMVGV